MLRGYVLLPGTSVADMNWIGNIEWSTAATLDELAGGGRENLSKGITASGGGDAAGFIKSGSVGLCSQLGKIMVNPRLRG